MSSGKRFARKLTSTRQAPVGVVTGAACAGILLAVYGATMAPSLTWAHHGADGGDLATAVVRHTIPHPPGSPTYLLLGDLFVRLPWRDPAWRLNLMSALAAAGAGGLTVVGLLSRRFLLLDEEPPADRRVVQQKTKVVKGRPSISSFDCAEDKPSPAGRRGVQPGASVASRWETGRVPAALAAGLALGLAPLLWSQALITEVYAPAAFFTALVGWLALRRGPAWLLGLAWGAGMGVHPTLSFLAPLVAWAAWRGPNGRWKGLLQAGLPALLAWCVMVGPVLLARSDTPSPWADVSTVAGWWALVSGRLYHGYLFGLPLDSWPRRLLAWAGMLARQFTVPGAVVAGVGLGHLWRVRCSLAMVSILAFGACSLYAVGYDTGDSSIFMVPALPLAGLWLGAGLVRLAGRARERVRRGAWVVLLLPLFQALLSWGAMDVSEDRVAMDWAGRVLEEAPAQALLLAGQDTHTFALWYIHDALGERPDVVVVDRDLWVHPPYYRAMSHELGFEGGESDVSPEEAARRAGRPLVAVGP
jgi:hypothetical protein